MAAQRARIAIQHATLTTVPSGNFASLLLKSYPKAIDTDCISKKANAATNTRAATDLAPALNAMLLEEQNTELHDKNAWQLWW